VNQELEELIRLYEAMHACIAGEQERTSATKALEAAVLKSAITHGIPFNTVMGHVKEKYHARARAEDRRKSSTQRN